MPNTRSMTARDPAHGARSLWSIALLAAALAAACSVRPPPADNAQIFADIAARRAGSEETVGGTVVRLLPQSQGPSGVHERFVVEVRDGGSRIPLYVTDNVSVGEVAPLHMGDQVVVKGELAFNQYGPLLHWTHRDPRLRHVPGFVEVGGRMYE